MDTLKIIGCVAAAAVLFVWVLISLKRQTPVKGKDLEAARNGWVPDGVEKNLDRSIYLIYRRRDIDGDASPRARLNPSTGEVTVITPVKSGSLKGFAEANEWLADAVRRQSDALSALKK